jgi:hypothetical protein
MQMNAKQKNSTMSLYISMLKTPPDQEVSWRHGRDRLNAFLKTYFLKLCHCEEAAADEAIFL